jgi:riboflavin kinase / FMN adenylyltransferase
MKIIEGLAHVARPFPDAVITMGNFDGVHRGHRTIIDTVITQARARGGTSVVYTFYPHPVKILAPEACPPLIHTLDQRLEAFSAMGIDVCIVDHFTLNLAHQEPREFFESALLTTLGARALVVGYDLTFGLHRRGTVELLEQLGHDHGVDVTVIEAQFVGELLISSTEIRRLIAAGEVARAREIMDAPFALRGRVVTGLGLGGNLGAHTANVAAENELIPREGVYISLSRPLDESMVYPSITSLGTNPTFPHQPFKIETHLLDFEGALVGKEIEVHFLERLRGQVAFDSAAMLKEQIKRDITQARTWHETHSS